MAETASRAPDTTEGPAERKTSCQNIKFIHLKSQEIIDAIPCYHGKKIPTFPLSKNKIPLVKEWNDRDFTFEEHDRPDVVGIGSCPGRWAIPVMNFDLDGPQGRGSWAGCLEQYGALPPTYSVKTGRVDGGEQFYYRTPPGLYVKSTASEFAPKIDIRGTRGQAVLPPTTHKSGKKYQWQFDGHPCKEVEPDKIPMLPAPWIQALIDTGNAYYPDQQKDRSSERREFSGHSTAYALKALELETEKVRQAVKDTRNNSLNDAAFRLGTLVAGGELSRNLVENTLLDAAIDAGLPEREAKKTIASGLKAGEREPRQAPRKDAGGGSAADGPAEQEPDESPETKKAWTYARELIPRTPYPWEILPPVIAASLRRLARACASTAAPLPGFSCAFIAAAVGRKVAIAPKGGWVEPLIFWFFDLHDSGEGKTAKMRSLARLFMQVQRDKQAEYNQKYEEWATQPKKERGDPPGRPRGYYFTNLTLEGVHAESENHPTGGMVAMLNEASTFIGGQNEYKAGKGTDREAWLSLHDGNDARIIRAAKSVLITGARIQIIGGIQPAVFRRVFGGDDKLYLYDGTVYRGLYTYNPPRHHPLTLEAWGDEHREPWERTLKRAMEWADAQEKPHVIPLNSEAQDLFFNWRNSLDRKKTKLPAEIRGFLPKTYGTALRLAGVIDILHTFYEGHSPRVFLDAEGMQRGIDAAMFYLGQSVDAMRLILGDELTVDPVKARILEALQDRGEMTATDINNDVFQRNQSADKIQAALNELVEAGQVTAATEPTGGRAKTKYAMNEKNELTKKDQGEEELNSFNSLNSSISDFENNDDEVEI